jgi:protein-disulfide isomerase
LQDASSDDGIAQTAEPDVLATVAGEDITMEDIRSRVGPTLDQLETKYMLERSQSVETTLQAIIRDRVLLAEARDQGTTVEAMIIAEAGGSLTPTDVEVSAWYAENQPRLGGRSLEEVQPQIVQYLQAQKRQDAQIRLQERLNEEYGVEVFLERFRLTFDHTGSPSFGPDDAPVTLVEFSDFECPFCARFFPTLQQVKASYPERVRIVYRQFPLTNLHPNAFKAAEASLCAHDQGSFWEMHDLLFQEQASLTVRDLKEKAGRLGLDQDAFDQCLDTGQKVAQVQEDFAEGQRVGANGTPALFLNGVPVEGGAVGFEVLEPLIEQELVRLER